MVERVRDDINNGEFRSSVRRGRRFIGGAAAGLCIFGGAAVYSMTHATAEDSFGPHQAVYSLNDSGKVIANLGPLGTVGHDSAGLLPTSTEIFNLGATITVGEIPDDALIPTDTASLVGHDLGAYAKFFENPQTTINRVTHELIDDAVEHTLVYGGEISVGLIAAYLILGSRRRQEIVEAIKKRRLGITSAMIVGLALSGFSAGDATPQAFARTPGSPIFENTALAGTYVTGRLGDIVNTYGKEVIDYIDKDNAYYNMIAQNVTAALGSYGTPGNSTEAYTTALVVSDLHCNVGMANAIHAAAVGTHTEIIIDSGDEVMSGTAVEKYCVDAFSASTPKGVVKVIAPGNHDSSITVSQEKKDGVVVLDGKIVTVDGLTILGDSDPYFNEIGQPVRHVTQESVAQLGDRLASLACAQPSAVNILVVHRPEAAQASINEGCVDTALSGHKHSENGPNILTNGSIEYTSGTTGGAKKDMLTIGTKLGTDAKMSVWLFSKTDGKAVAERTITVHTDGSVELSPWENTQQAAQQSNSQFQRLS